MTCFLHDGEEKEPDTSRAELSWRQGFRANRSQDFSQQLCQIPVRNPALLGGSRRNRIYDYLAGHGAKLSRTSGKGGKIRGKAGLEVLQSLT
jgi:hypothetical protein